MKKAVILFLVVTFFALTLSGCMNTDSSNGNPSEAFPNETTSPSEATNPSTEPANNEETTNPSTEPANNEETTNSPKDTSKSEETKKPSEETEKLPDMTELSKEVETQIKQTHLNYLHDRYPDATLDDVFIQKYYGKYNGSIAVMITDNFTDYTQAIWSETIADTVINYVNGNYIVVWRDGVFHKLQSAYNQGFLEKESITQIAAIHNNI